MIAKSNFHSCNVFSENLVAIEMRKLEVKFGKPIYVGMCILNILKYICMIFTMSMYMASLFRDKCKIIYTDTDNDSYIMWNDDGYNIMKHDINRFDTSDYSIDNPMIFRSQIKKFLVSWKTRTMVSS